MSDPYELECVQNKVVQLEDLILSQLEEIISLRLENKSLRGQLEDRRSITSKEDRLLRMTKAILQEYEHDKLNVDRLTSL
ncbi:hypothetical protein SAMN04487895_117101 [Paenibacillus sophorae]|uniref:Uncharacterized protein n=1 Tax=Paenibacillus sophorae TaxID=1333845 RepID=A0A1H8UIA3_9BACL|nr:hypothetical protein [Paenibacillus sophorae]QWU13134.1 hypothetical protein KP014_13925 [Paenibacillus sophorae]SEP02338.1 hypothetical protein SAMN04487895_117101 [Paenibacillus sophorae]